MLGSPFPSDLPLEFAPLSWEHVREMARHGVEFGAHTRTHPILARLSDDAERMKEIEGSKRRIEEELQKPADHFCYPNGSEGDFSERCVETVRQVGFRTAVTTIPGLNDVSSDLLRLQRIGVDPWVKMDYFERCLAGFRLS
jgi:peptidoglycan/xylan/chitin deacetylase (PgdA/CDA1 family)